MGEHALHQKSKLVFYGFLLLIFLSYGKQSFAQPTISSFSPESGPAGSTITVTGTNFSETPEENIVYFGTAKGTVISSSAISVTVTVPASASYLPLTVTTNKLTAYSYKPFIITFAGGEGSITKNSFSGPVALQGSFNNAYFSVNDLNDDGKPDAAVCNSSGDKILLYNNESTGGNIVWGSEIQFPAGINANTLVCHDINGDGKPDFLLTDFANAKIAVIENTSSVAGFALGQQLIIPITGRPANIAADDLDKDGKPDLIVSMGFDSNAVAVYRNTSAAGNISFADKINFETGYNPTELSSTDFDGDGRPDIAVVNSTAENTISILQNTSTAGNISFAAKKDILTGGFPRDIVTGDFDGDSKADIAVSNSYENYVVSIFRNTSTNGNISMSYNQEYAIGWQSYGITMGDATGDGKPDLIVAQNFYPTAVGLFKNISTPGNIKMETKTDLEISNNPFTVALCDLNADGKPEIVAGRAFVNNQLAIFQNQTGTPLALNTEQFNAVIINKQVYLQWRTSNATNTSHFIAEHSNDGIHFSAIGTVMALDNSILINNYSFIHRQPFNGVNYYRLTTVEKDGSLITGNIVQVEFNRLENKLLIYPNPAVHNFTAAYPLRNKPAQLYIFDMQGKLVKTISVLSNTSKTEIYAGNLAGGIYRIVLSDQDNTYSQTMMLK